MLGKDAFYGRHKTQVCKCSAQTYMLMRKNARFCYVLLMYWCKTQIMKRETYHYSFNVSKHFFQASVGTGSTTSNYQDYETSLVDGVDFKIGLSVALPIVALCFAIYFTFLSVISLRKKWQLYVQRKGIECKQHSYCWIECQGVLDSEIHHPRKYLRYKIPFCL